MSSLNSNNGGTCNPMDLMSSFKLDNFRSSLEMPSPGIGGGDGNVVDHDLICASFLKKHQDAAQDSLQKQQRRRMERHHGFSTTCSKLTSLDALGGPTAVMSNMQQTPTKTKGTAKQQQTAAVTDGQGMEIAKPKRPLTAYNLFFRSERAKMVGEEPPKSITDQTADERMAKKRRRHRKTHGKVGFQEMAKQIGQKWKELDKSEKKEFEAEAAEDLKRYRSDMERYRQTLHVMSGKTGQLLQADGSSKGDNQATAANTAGCQQTGSFLKKDFHNSMSVPSATIMDLLQRAASSSSPTASSDMSAFFPNSRQLCGGGRNGKMMTPQEHRNTLQRALDICQGLDDDVDLPITTTPHGMMYGGHNTSNIRDAVPEPQTSAGSLGDLETDLRDTLGHDMIGLLSNLDGNSQQETSSHHQNDISSLEPIGSMPLGGIDSPNDDDNDGIDLGMIASMGEDSFWEQQHQQQQAPQQQQSRRVRRRLNICHSNRIHVNLQ